MLIIAIMKKSFLRKNFEQIILVTLLLLYPAKLFASVMSSTNFAIYVDTVSVGGLRSTSTNFGLFDNLADVGGSPTSSTSTSYRVDSGFIASSPDPSITANLSTSNISLGTLSDSAVRTDSHTITVTTNSPTGYTTTMTTDGNLRDCCGHNITGVGDGSVSAGSNEYGIRTSGSEGQQNSSDIAPSASGFVIASASGPITSSQTTITFKAAMASAGLTPGSYSQSVTYTTVGNF
ncbi:MAG: hypothetical protein HW383_359 [Candidatus Magasanikbacteria bacterium]|nr:hypothetical protein [Candidatus Magasanikbacteria bacterium]